jgi:hypothetical protein
MVPTAHIVGSQSRRIGRSRASVRKRLFNEVVGSVRDELRHLREIEQEGDLPVTVLLVLAQVLCALVLIVGAEMTVVFAFYFGWL